jgi:hypothetical protein
MSAKDRLAAQTDEMNFIEREKTCGTCIRCGVIDQGDMCQCRKDGKYHKFYDEACNEHKFSK